MAPTIHTLCLWAPCAFGWHGAASQHCPFACSKAAVSARQDCRSTPGVMLQPPLCGTLQREGSGDGSVWHLLAFGTLRGRSGASEVVPAFLLCVRRRSCPGWLNQRAFVLTCMGHCSGGKMARASWVCIDFCPSCTVRVCNSPMYVQCPFSWYLGLLPSPPKQPPCPLHTLQTTKPVAFHFTH